MENISVDQPAKEGTQENFFTGSVPRNYDTFMGPVLLNPYAQDLVSRVKAKGPLAILELAAGTGRVTKPLLAAMPEANITATDISEDMMEIGKEQITSAQVKWQNVNMMEIPYPDNEFDLVICQFGLIFVPDKAKAVAEMRRVLKPGGQLLFNTWGNMEENPVWHISLQLFRQTFGEMPMPKDMSPFSLPVITPVVALMTEAGFTDASGTEVRKITEVESAAIVAKGFLMTQPSLREKKELYDEMYRKLVKELGEKLGDSPLRSPLLALVFEATK